MTTCCFLKMCIGKRILETEQKIKSHIFVLYLRAYSVRREARRSVQSRRFEMKVYNTRLKRHCRITRLNLSLCLNNKVYPSMTHVLCLAPWLIIVSVLLFFNLFL